MGVLVSRPETRQNSEILWTLSWHFRFLKEQEFKTTLNSIRLFTHTLNHAEHRRLNCNNSNNKIQTNILVFWNKLLCRLTFVSRHSEKVNAFLSRVIFLDYRKLEVESWSEMLASTHKFTTQHVLAFVNIRSNIASLAQYNVAYVRRIYNVWTECWASELLFISPTLNFPRRKNIDVNSSKEVHVSFYIKEKSWYTESCLEIWNGLISASFREEQEDSEETNSQENIFCKEAPIRFDCYDLKHN